MTKDTFLIDVPALRALGSGWIINRWLAPPAEDVPALRA